MRTNEKSIKITTDMYLAVVKVQEAFKKKHLKLTKKAVLNMIIQDYLNSKKEY